MAHDPSLDHYFNNIYLEHAITPELKFTYFDERSESEKVSFSANITQINSDLFFEVESNALISADEGKQLADWIYKSLGL